MSETQSSSQHRVMNRRLPATLLLWAAPAVFLGLFYFLPVGSILELAARTALLEGLTVNFWPKVVRPLGFTLWQAGLSAAATLLIGLPAAYLFARFDFRGKAFLWVLSTLPFILPTVVVAASFNALLGPRGWLNQFLMALFALESAPVRLVNSLGAIVIAHVFYNTSVVIRVVGSAWEQLDPRLEQAARVLGASPLRALREVTLPLLRPAILSAALLVFLFDFTSFGVVLLLGGPRFSTLEVEIYIQTLHMLNLPLAGLLSAIQLGITLLLTFAQARLNREKPIPLAPRVRGEGKRKPKSGAEKAFVGLSVAVLAVLLVAPLVALALRSVIGLEGGRGSQAVNELTLVYYRSLFENPRQSIFYVPPIEAIRNSLVYAGSTVGITVLLGFCIAYALKARTRANRAMDALLMLPLGTSAVTLGLGFILAFHDPYLGKMNLPWMVPVAHSLVALPFMVRTLQPALESIPKSYRQAAAVMGASPLRVWLEVDLPILSRAVVVGCVFAFTISLGEFGATTFLSRPEYPTMPVAIFAFLSKPGALNYGQALAMATILMVVCALGIWVVEKMQITETRAF